MTYITRNMLRHSLLQMMAQPHMHLPGYHQQMPLRCKALHQADQGPPYLQYYCHSNTTSSTVIKHGRASGQQQTAAACHHCSSTCAINCTGPDSQKPLSVSARLPHLSASKWLAGDSFRILLPQLQLCHCFIRHSLSADSSLAHLGPSCLSSVNLSLARHCDADGRNWMHADCYKDRMAFLQWVSKANGH